MELKNRIFNLGFIWPLLVIFAAWSHYLIFGEDTFILIHDNLDSVFVNLKVMASEGLYFAPSDTIIKSFGINFPREILPGQYYFICVLFYFLPYFWAYSINALLVSVIGYFSMRSFLNYISKNESENLSLVLSSLCFALLPFWPYCGITIAGMPFVFLCFLKILNHEHKWYHVLLILLAPLYSTFTAAIFISMILGLVLLYDIVKTRKVNWMFGILLICYTCIFLLMDYRLVNHVINHTFVSQRTEFSRSFINGSKLLRKFFDLFIKGQYHAISAHALVILPSTVAALLLSRKRLNIDSNSRNLLITLAAVIISCFMSVFWIWDGSEYLRVIPIAKILKLERMYFFFPFLWGCAFYFALRIIESRFPKKIVVSVFLLQFCYLVYKSDFYSNYKGIRTSYKSFFAQKEFSDLKQFLPPDSGQFYSMAIGFHPAVLIFNDLKTLDFYQPHYPLAYKKLFSTFIEDEISKNKDIHNYFYKSGIRAYFFSNQVGILDNEHPHSCPAKDISIPSFNYQNIRKVGGRFFYSVCMIRGWRETASISSIAHGTIYLYDLNQVKLN